MIHHLLGSSAGQTVSFDIFDTLITRVWLRPRDVFLAVGRALRDAGLIASTPEVWVARRVEAERLAHAAQGDGAEIRHDAIYHHLTGLCGWSTSEAETARQIEVERELASMRPIAESVDALAAHLAAGGEALLLSDMYLEPSLIARILAQRAPALSRCTLHVSSETGHRKHTGALFRYVLEQRRGAPPIALHVGDNHRADVAQARATGIVAHHYAPARLTRFEKRLDSRSIGDPLLRSAVAGAARAARLSRSFQNPHEAALWRIGTTVAGPMITSFVVWLLQRASEDGVDQLYFVARDGQVLLRVAELLCACLGLDIRCSYLYGSRQGWHLPGVTEIGEFERGWMLEQFSRHTLRALLKRVDIEPEGISDALTRVGIAPGRWDQKLTLADGEALNRLLEDPEAEAAILDSAARHRALALDYFRTEGLFEAVRPGLVDIGWQGRLQRSLCRMMQTEAPEFHTRLHGYYLGLRRHAAFEEGGRFKAFSAPRRTELLAAGSAGVWALVEVFTTADHGSLRRFERAPDGHVRPVLIESGFQEPLEWGAMVQQDAIVAYARELCDAAKLGGLELDGEADGFKQAALQAFERFAAHPDRDEADAYGAYPEFSDQQHATGAELASALRPVSVLPFLAMPEAFFGRGVWHAGMLARSVPSALRAGLLSLFELRRILFAATGLYPLVSATAKRVVAALRGRRR